MYEKTTKTLTVAQLVTTLKKFPQNYKVYLSSDSEGNTFGTIEPKWSFGYNPDDKTLTLYPFEDHLDDEDVAPKQMVKIRAELEAERKAKKG